MVNEASVNTPIIKISMVIFLQMKSLIFIECLASVRCLIYITISHFIHQAWEFVMSNLMPTGGLPTVYHTPGSMHCMFYRDYLI
jgi:hypothetical protein